jgi:hypothetical protein
MGGATVGPTPRDQSAPGVKTGTRRPPADLPPASRVAPTELTTYAVTALLVEAKLEEDGDIHLIVADPADPSLTMVVELAEPTHARLALTRRLWR